MITKFIVTKAFKYRIFSVLFVDTLGVFSLKSVGKLVFKLVLSICTMNLVIEKKNNFKENIKQNKRNIKILNNDIIIIAICKRKKIVKFNK